MHHQTAYRFWKAIAGLVPVIAFLYPFEPATAQQKTDTLTSKKTFDEIVVTGQYGESSLTKSAYKVRIIDQKRITQLGANNLKDVLVNELNVRVQNDPALGGSVSIQGISGQNVKILIDGVPVIGREGGIIDLNQINLNNIERIELVEGPMSVNFGTDALGGVINLISKQSNHQHIGVTTYYESIGQYNAGINGGITWKKWSLNTNVARNFFEGYNPQASSRKKLWKPREQYFGDISLRRKFEKGSLKYALSAFYEKVSDRDSAVITPYFAYGDDAYFYTRRISQSLNWEFKPRTDYTIHVVGSYNYYQRIRNKVRKDLVTLKETMNPMPYEHDTNYFYAAMSRGTLSRSRKQAKLNYQVGYELNHETNTANRIVGNSKTMYDANLFGSTELKPHSRILIRPGLRIIYNNQFAAPLIPSLNIRWDVNSFTTIRASYGRGFRAPSLKELYLNFVDPSHNIQGNQQLRAETQHNYQFSAQFEINKFERLLRIEPALFYNHIYNKIDLVMLNASTLEAQYNNISEYKSTGANLNIDYRAPHYSLVMGVAVIGINNTIPNQPATDDFFFTREARINANYVFTKANLTASLFYKFNGKVRNFTYDVVSGQIINGFIDSYSLMDATLSKQLFNKSLTVTAGSKNLLNVVNIAANLVTGVHSTGSNSANIAMGRTYFISCAYTLTYSKKNG